MPCHAEQCHAVAEQCHAMLLLNKTMPCCLLNNAMLVLVNNAVLSDVIVCL